MIRLPRKVTLGIFLLLLVTSVSMLTFHEGTKMALDISLRKAQEQIDSFKKGSGSSGSKDSNDSTPRFPTSSNDIVKENATLYTLCQNKDLRGMISAVASVERQFNSKYHYDWVFLNDDEFDSKFKEAIRAKVSGNVYFGKIDTEAWGYPDWIDLDKAAETRKWMVEKNVVYGELESYHHMCRFQSGYFFRHPLMEKYKYAWRVEPGISIRCKLKQDPFKLMRINEYIYGFNVAPHDIADSILTLWDSTKKFLNLHENYIDSNNLENFISDDKLETYNLCHYWTNFEITDMDWLRSDAYMEYFNFLDKEGGFYYERWGDAPVRSIAASLFLPRDKIYFFNEIGYFHSPFGHCPYNQGPLELECDCQVNDDEYSNTYYDYHANSCLRKYFQAKGRTYHDANPNLEDNF